jgi:type I restriction enzyme M protein
VAQDYLRELNPRARLEAFGQELNPETYAVCRSDMMLKGQKASNIHLGNSFSEDAFAGQRFDYLLANPPFGVEWKKVERVIRDERERLGFDGRFGAGLPRVTDGSFLFLQHMISKLKRPEEGGGRLAVFKRVLDDRDFQAAVMEHYLRRVFEQARAPGRSGGV